MAATSVTAALPAPPPEAGAKVPVKRYGTTSWRRVMADSLRYFDPRRAVHNPVMFTVYVLTIFLLLITFLPGLFPDLRAGHNAPYDVGLCIILVLTLWFANLSDAIAEARGRAQADSLRQIRSGIQARQ